jgi:hypothetical protein
VRGGDGTVAGADRGAAGDYVYRTEACVSEVARVARARSGSRAGR